MHLLDEFGSYIRAIAFTELIPWLPPQRLQLDDGRGEAFPGGTCRVGDVLASY